MLTEETVGLGKSTLPVEMTFSRSSSNASDTEDIILIPAVSMFPRRMSADSHRKISRIDGMSLSDMNNENLSESLYTGFNTKRDQLTNENRCR